MPVRSKCRMLSPGEVTSCCSDGVLPYLYTRGSTVKSGAGTWQEHGLNPCQSQLGGCHVLL